MAGGVAVGGDRAWLVPGRIAGRLFDRARTRIAAGSAVADELDAGLANNLLALDRLPPEVATQVRQVLAGTAAAEVAAIDADPSASPDDRAYRDSLRELLALLA